MASPLTGSRLIRNRQPLQHDPEKRVAVFRKTFVGRESGGLKFQVP
jgi:hypothetical protein